MGLNLEYISGQTPLDEDEKEGLLIPTIATRTELDDFEQQNIEDALQWVLGKTLKTETILTEKFIRNLHKRMFSHVWEWVGQYRKTNKNLGIDKWQIPVALKALCDDTLFWIQNETLTPAQIAIQFKHKIVCIHCFPNGNGRHSRLMADIIIDKIYGLPLFSWGANDLTHQNHARTTDLKALRAADKGNYEMLLKFART